MSLLCCSAMLGIRSKLLPSMVRFSMEFGATRMVSESARNKPIRFKLTMSKNKRLRVVSGWSRVELKRDMKVCVIGASGGVGSKVALLLKLSRLIDWLTIHDIQKDIHGVAKDLSHISTKTQVFGYIGSKRLQDALLGAHVVIICASKPRMSQMSVEDMFESNAPLMVEIANTCIEMCPKACVLVVSQPVESLVPLIAQVYIKKGVFDPRKLIGVTSANVIRSTSVLSQCARCDPLDIIVPVLGGHSAKTIVPIFSSAHPDPMAVQGRPDKRAVVERILAPYRMYEPSNVVKASIHNMNLIVKSAEDAIFRVKDGTESASITGAAAAAGTAIKLIIGLSTNRPSADYAYVQTDRVEGVSYCTVPVQFGPGGIWKHFKKPSLSHFEQQLIKEAIQHMKINIRRGEEYIKNRKWVE